MSKGFILTTYNDIDLVEKAYNSFINSVTGPYAFTIIDGGSTDGTEKWIETKVSQMWLGKPIGAFVDLSLALNKGFEIMTYMNTDHIFWIHTDMEFTKDWDEALITYLIEHRNVGKVSSDIIESKDVDRPGNQCPWCITKRTLDLLKLSDGYWFDEGFRGIGGYEDWDLNRRIMNLGLEVRITPTSLVHHKGAGSRFKPGRDTNPEQRFNAGYYQKKWRDNKCPV